MACCMLFEKSDKSPSLMHVLCRLDVNTTWHDPCPSRYPSLQELKLQLKNIEASLFCTNTRDNSAALEYAFHWELLHRMLDSSTQALHLELSCHFSMSTPRTCRQRWGLDRSAGIVSAA